MKTKSKLSTEIEFAIVIIIWLFIGIILGFSMGYIYGISGTLLQCLKLVSLIL